MDKYQKIVFKSATFTFIYLMCLLMYELGLFEQLTFGLVVLAVAIFGSCIFAIHVWVLANKVLINDICTFKLKNPSTLVKSDANSGIVKLGGVVFVLMMLLAFLEDLNAFGVGFGSGLFVSLNG